MNFFFQGDKVKIMKNEIIVDGKTQCNLQLISLKLRENLHANLVENGQNMGHRRMEH